MIETSTMRTLTNDVRTTQLGVGSLLESMQGGPMPSKASDLLIFLDTKFDELLQWLCPSTVSPKRDQRQLRDKHVTNTSLWIFEDSIYKEWAERQGSFLWLHGQSKYPFIEP